MGTYGSSVTPDAFIHSGASTSLFRRNFCTLALCVTLTMMLYDITALDGVIPLMQTYFGIADSMTGLLQTLSTVISSVALIFVGLFGDRVDKRSFTLLAIALWLIPNGLALFVPANMYWLFVFLRTLAAIGHAVYMPFLPVIFSDFYRDGALARALVVMSLVTFVGVIFSGMITSFFLTSGLPWQTALAPSLVVVFPLFVLLLCAMPQSNDSTKKSRGYIEDIKQLFSIKSYLFLVCCGSFAMIYSKASGFWMPSLIYYGWTAGGTEVYGTLPYAGVVTINNTLFLAGSLIGIPLVMFAAESWQYGGALTCKRKCSRAIPIVAGLAQIIGASVTVLDILTLRTNYAVNLPTHFIMSFVGAPMASLLPQLVLTIAPRNQRATAYALSSLVSGIISSPSAQIAGMLSDAYRGEAEDAKTRFDAIAFALLILIIFFFTAFIFNLLIVKYYPSDVAKKRSEEALESPLLSPGDDVNEDEKMNRRGSVFERSFASRTNTIGSIY